MPNETQPSLLPSPAELLRELVALPAPPGQEQAIRSYLIAHLQTLGLPFVTDPKGNLLTAPAQKLPDSPRVVVTAHMDEIALMVAGMTHDGALTVAPLGGAHPWKWGEGAVEIFAAGGVILPGVLSFGSIHTTSPYAIVQQVRDGRPFGWESVRVHTGLDRYDLTRHGVHPGQRIVLARDRRRIWEIGGGQIGSYFLDDRADLVAWLLSLEALSRSGGYEDILFAATSSEEVGGEGALYLLTPLRPEICVALEIGPTTPDAPFPVDSNPTVWVSDTFAAADPRDLDLIRAAARTLGISPHWQAVTRGGSDASCAASKGLCARPVTLAFAAENSHGFEIMHRDSPKMLARLLIAYLREERGAQSTEQEVVQAVEAGNTSAENSESEAGEDS